MQTYILRRFGMLVPVWLGITLLVFVLSELSPGDPAAMILEQQLGQPPTIEQLQAQRERMGLNDPPVVRYARWAADATRGDLGTSYRSGRPVVGVLVSRSWVTLQMAVPAFLVALAVSLLVGLVAAVKRNTVVDHASRVGSLTADSIPTYWLAYLLILLFAVKLGWFPVAGRGTWQHVVLPVVTLGIGTTATMMRLTRSSLLEVLGEDYIRTARAVGVRDRRVIAHHALRNAMIPVVTVAGMILGHFVTGTVIVEYVFAWPGVGKYVVDAIFNRDLPVVQGFVLFAGAVFVFVNLLVDLSYAWLDPRVRFSGGTDGDR
ncbi:MAG TPA: nickel ABC transporter permease [Egibacteraceae bacterium]|jgi:peptide/nickel transport system permease protein|nr:nickel ABC transporter permease [Egibacteraceae bacterium]